MSGETEKELSGWTTDTLRYYVQQQLDDLRTNFQQQLDDLQNMLQERYETQTKAVDAAFLAQKTAMETALTAAEKAVQVAQGAAEKATEKAELAADKRFEAVNEFRQTLSDQTATFMPRTEAETRMTSISEKADAGITRNAERISGMELDLRALTSGMQGGDNERQEARAQHGTTLGSRNLILGIAGFGVTLLFLVIAGLTLYLATKGTGK